jgi:hypothetical protein
MALPLKANSKTTLLLVQSQTHDQPDVEHVKDMGAMIIPRLNLKLRICQKFINQRLQIQIYPKLEVFSPQEGK